MTGSKKIESVVIGSILLVAVMHISCCTSESDSKIIEDSSKITVVDDLFKDAKKEYESQNYRNAERLFHQAYLKYLEQGYVEKAYDARNWKLRSSRMTLRFPYNRTEAEKIIAARFPNVSLERRLSWLDGGVSPQLVSDGEILYSRDIVRNIYSHNLDLMREELLKLGRTPFYDDAKHIAFQNDTECSGYFCNPTTFEGVGNLSIPRDLLPKTGLLQLWIPLPVETDSQVNVTILSIEPTEFIKKGPDTTGDIGNVYLEVPLDGREDDLNISVKFRFTEYEKRFIINPAQMGTYDKESNLYRKFTSAGGDIFITPEIVNEAQSIVGNETNPFLQAQMIYHFIIDTFPYTAGTPHLALYTAKIPESLYIYNTHFGDCGTQSRYFCALCRSLGIPARTIVGFQIFPGIENYHAWGEFYLPEYGWIPIDVTFAETADWSFNATEEDRDRFKDFYFGNLDPYRFVIQKDIDIPLDPDPGDAVIYSAVHQWPAAFCNTSEDDLDIKLLDYWKVSFENIPATSRGSSDCVLS